MKALAIYAAVWLLVFLPSPNALIIVLSSTAAPSDSRLHTDVEATGADSPSTVPNFKD
jgi:hypothetical protein